ncbi:MAG TPA: PASTA domain-containing protein [bacterium]|nr:PASTA domain-containing protein [bacterium]
MKKYLISFLISLLTVFSLMILDKMEMLPWQFILKPSYTIPDLKELTVENALVVCRIKGMELTVKEVVYSEKYPAGNVISQNPSPGEKSSAPSVEVILSKGRPLAEVPKVVSLSLSEAIEEIRKSGLTAGATRYLEASSPRDTVIKVIPEHGIKLPFNSPVELILSQGEKKVKIPSLAGKTLPEAQRILSQHGLKLGIVKKTVNIDKDFGIVLKQWPPAGRETSPGTSITVVLNEEEE